MGESLRPYPDTGEAPAAMLSVEALSRLLSISTRQVFRLAASQKLPAHVLVGQRRRWKRSELMCWIEAGCPGRDEWEMLKADRPG